MELTDLNLIINRELEFNNADMFYKHSVTKTIELAPEPLPVKIVPGELSQVFQNLLTNALHAMLDTTQPRIEVKSGINGDHVWFSIQDNGPGIPKDIQNKIFDPFFTTKPKDAVNGEPVGTGLGLYMSMEMIKTYDGEIVLESEPDHGTLFKILLPKAK